MLVISQSQTKVLSNFFADIAKGLFLGIALNQFLPSASSPWIKIFVSFSGIIISLIFLNIALYFSKEERLWFMLMNNLPKDLLPSIL